MKANLVKKLGKDLLIIIDILIINVLADILVFDFC